MQINFFGTRAMAVIQLLARKRNVPFVYANPNSSFRIYYLPQLHKRPNTMTESEHEHGDRVRTRTRRPSPHPTAAPESAPDHGPEHGDQTWPRTWRPNMAPAHRVQKYRSFDQPLLRVGAGAFITHNVPGDEQNSSDPAILLVGITPLPAFDPYCFPGGIRPVLERIP